MSYLIRTGTGQNNISWSTTANSSTKYLRRLGSGRNNIAWMTIPNGSTYNILQRNGTGRNNVLWAELKMYKQEMLLLYELCNDFSLNDICAAYCSKSGSFAFRMDSSRDDSLSYLDISPAEIIYSSDTSNLHTGRSVNTTDYLIGIALNISNDLNNIANSIINMNPVFESYIGIYDKNENYINEDDLPTKVIMCTIDRLFIGVDLQSYTNAVFYGGNGLYSYNITYMLY